MKDLEASFLEPNLTLGFGIRFAGAQERLHANVGFLYSKGIHSTLLRIHRFMLRLELTVQPINQSNTFPQSSFSQNFNLMSTSLQVLSQIWLRLTNGLKIIKKGQTDS